MSVTWANFDAGPEEWDEVPDDPPDVDLRAEAVRKEAEGKHVGVAVLLYVPGKSGGWLQVPLTTLKETEPNADDGLDDRDDNDETTKP